jgi:hypothetical protein
MRTTVLARVPRRPQPRVSAQAWRASLQYASGPGEEITLLDREDVSAAPGILDLAWLLTASVALGGWDEAISTYGPSIHLGLALPAVMLQGPFMLSDMTLGSPEARAQSGRLGEALRRLA